MATFPASPALTPPSRSRSDRWLGGVSGGIARRMGIRTAWVRMAFVLAGLAGGAGVLVYLAAWSIVPHEGEEPGREASRWPVRLALACVVCLGMAALAALAAAATLFGFGWVTIVLAAVVLLVVLVGWPRLGPAWALIPIAAIAAPAAAVAAGGVQLVPDAGHVTVAPRVLAPGGRATFRAGLGTLLVDLRRTALPATGALDVRVQGGVRRTIVALPHGRCIHLQLHYAVKPFWAQVAGQFVGHEPTSEIVDFGAGLPLPHGVADYTSPLPGPVLRLDFTSAGGSLYVRDYPDGVDPETHPSWPGFPVSPEPRPDVRRLSRRQARFELGAWRTRHALEVRSSRLVQSLMGGPCASGGAPL